MFNENDLAFISIFNKKNLFTSGSYDPIFQKFNIFSTLLEMGPGGLFNIIVGCYRPAWDGFPSKL